MSKSWVAVNCTNHKFMAKKKLTFLIFPYKERYCELWEKWVQACRRDNADGGKWKPKGQYVFLCLEHFITSMFDLNFYKY